MLRACCLLASLWASSGLLLAQPCTTSWNNPLGGAWETADNWSDGVPDAADTVCITLEGTYTVAQSRTDRSVAGLLLGGASGTQTLTTFNAFTVTNATVGPNGVWEVLNRVPGGGDGVYSTGTLTIEGLLIQHGGTSFLTTGGTLDVAPSGTFRLVGAGAGGPAATFRLRGLLDGADCPTCSVNAPLNVQGGTIRASSGRLDVNDGGTIADATVDALADANLWFRGPFTATGTLGGTPAGTFFVTGTTLAAGPGGATLAVGGTGLQLSGSAFLTSAGGSFTNTGLLRKATTGSNFAGFRAVIVTNRGTVDFTTSFRLEDGAVLRNEPGATVLLSAGGSLSGNGRLDNAGLLLREGNRPAIGGTYNFGGLLRSLPGSEIRSNEDRTDLSAPGSRTIPDGVTLTGTGRFGIGRELDIQGTVSPGTEAVPLARLTFQSAYRPSLVAGSPRLVIDVDAGGRSDTLAVLFSSGPTANVQLAGTLVVRVRPGYTPAVGDVFTVMTNGRAITGQFSQVVAQDAPDGIAFVTERSPDTETLFVRAVAVAPDGPITVSTTDPVGGAVRSIFFSGPGASGISAAQLVCTDCLDANAFGTIPATLVGGGTLVEARFDLISPRAFGFYDLVIQRPGLPNEVVPVTVRPFLSFTLPSGGLRRGMRTRPPGGGYNWSFLSIHNRTNASDPAYPFQRVERPVPTETSLALGTGSPFSTGVVFYESDTAPDPLDPPIVFGRILPSQDLRLNTGLRIDPDAVLFPEQTPAGPEDPRIPFGEPRPLFAVGAFHASFARSTAAIEAALRGAANGALSSYLANVDAADPLAVRTAIRDGVQFPSVGYFGGAFELLQRIVDRLAVTATPPAGLAETAATAFEAALKTAADGQIADMEATLASIEAGPAAVRALYDAEVAILLPEVATNVNHSSAVRRRDEPIDVRSSCSNSGGGIGADNIYDLAELNGGRGLNPGGGGGSRQCQPPAGPADPNDKQADPNLRCAFETVTVIGETITRCARYFLPMKRAADPIYYTIAFENLARATEPAEFVTITDTLDTRFNPATLEIVGTSSDSTFSYAVNGRVVTMRFVGINLPPNVTAPEGEGYVNFRVRPFAPLEDGAEVRNAASIVFDFNPAIRTGTVVHEVRSVADLAASVQATEQQAVGTQVAYTVQVANFQGDDATDVRLTMTPPAGPLVSVSTTVGTCSGSAPIVCDLGTLTELMETVAVEVVVQAETPGSLALTATATTTAFDGFLPNNRAAAVVEVRPVATEADGGLPTTFQLHAAYPNPFNPTTTLRFGLPQAAPATLVVYDVLGREVLRLLDAATLPAGWHTLTVDGSRLASGVYLYRLRAGSFTETRRMTLVK